MTSRFCKVTLEPQEEPAKFKPIFNWVHWMFGSINYVLASKLKSVPQSLRSAQIGNNFYPFFAHWFHTLHVVIYIFEVLRTLQQYSTQKKRESSLPRHFCVKSMPGIEYYTLLCFEFEFCMYLFDSHFWLHVDVNPKLETDHVSTGSIGCLAQLLTSLQVCFVLLW